jgi:predicted XRE-type DNA-binding protein
MEKMKNSNRAMIEVVEKAKRDRKKLTHITDKSKLSTQDIVKLGLCRHFVQFVVTRRLKISDISEMTDIPVTRLSEITNYKITKFTVDQLLKNLSLLAEHDAQIREYLVFFGKAAELPVLSVSKTRQLSRNLAEASAHS